MLLEGREKNNYNLLYSLNSPHLVHYNCLDKLAECSSYRMLFSFAAELDPVQVAYLKEGGKNKSTGLWTTLLRKFGADIKWGR